MLSDLTLESDNLFPILNAKSKLSFEKLLLLLSFRIGLNYFAISLFLFQNNDIMEKCLALFQLDYNTVEINNRTGDLSSHYPSLLVIPENEKQKPNGLSSTLQSSSMGNGSVTPPSVSLGLPNISVASNNSSTQRTQQQTIYENSYDPSKLRELMNKARFARSRTRFPVPVILYKGKFVCRSSTLSCGPELYTRSSFNYFFNTGTAAPRQSGSDDVDLCCEGIISISNPKLIETMR